MGEDRSGTTTPNENCWSDTSQTEDGGDSSSPPGTGDAVNFTLVPKVLDKASERNDKDSSIRSTTIETAKDRWIRTRQPNLLSKSAKKSLTPTDIAFEKNK